MIHRYFCTLSLSAELISSRQSKRQQQFHNMAKNVWKLPQTCSLFEGNISLHMEAHINAFLLILCSVCPTAVIRLGLVRCNDWENVYTNIYSVIHVDFPRTPMIKLISWRSAKKKIMPTLYEQVASMSVINWQRIQRYIIDDDRQ